MHTLVLKLNFYCSQNHWWEACGVIYSLVPRVRELACGKLQWSIKHAKMTRKDGCGKENKLVDSLRESLAGSYLMIASSKGAHLSTIVI